MGVTTTANVAVALEDGTDGVDNDNDTKIDESHDLPTLSFPGGQIVVDIPKLKSDASSTASTQALVVEYRTKLPVSKAGYSFLVRSKSGAGGSPLIMIKNRSVISGNPVTDSQVVVTTAYGSSLSGTTSTTMPTTVAGGSPDQSYDFTYTTAVGISKEVQLKLRIPTDWPAPNIHDAVNNDGDADTDEADEALNKVTDSGQGTVEGTDRTLSVVGQDVV